MPWSSVSAMDLRTQLVREYHRGVFSVTYLAERFGVSAGIIRLCFLLMAFMGTPILAGVLYAVLAVMMPARPLLIDARPYRREYWRREY